MCIRRRYGYLYPHVKLTTLYPLPYPAHCFSPRIFIRQGDSCVSGNRLLFF